MSDNDNSVNNLILAVRAGDASAFSRIVSLYEPLIRSVTAEFPESASLDEEDIRQEAVIVLYGAVCTFDLTREDITFGLYAKICIRNRMITILRGVEKNNPHINELTEDIEETGNDPESRAITEESFNILLDSINKSLTTLEKSIFSLYIQDKSYREIAESLGKPLKSVDNAICRIKAKIKKLI